MVVYADLLFLINFITVYIIISIINSCRNIEILFLKKISASVTGGIFSIFVYVNNYIAPVKIIVYLASVYIICKIAYGNGYKKNIYNMLVFLFITFVVQSVFLLIVSISQNKIALTLRNNILYFDVSPKVILLCFLVTYPCVYFLSKFVQLQKKNRIYNLTIINNGKSIDVKALFDSGNLLKEPISKKDVIILEKEFAKQILGDDENITEIPYHTVSGKGILKAFMPDIIFIDDTRFLELQYIAITDNKLSDFGEYNALIGNVGGN